MSVLLDEAVEQVDEGLAHADLSDIRVGNRPVPLDGFPMIGEVSDGVFLISGTYRDGLQGSPAIASTTVRLIRGEPAPEVELFSPVRRPIELRSRQESVKEAALHLTSLWVETGGRTPHQIPLEAVASVYEDRAKVLYEKLGGLLSLNPDMLCFLLAAPDVREVAGLVSYIKRYGE